MTPAERAVFRTKTAVAQAVRTKDELYIRYLEACDIENRLRNALWGAELALARELADPDPEPGA